MNLNIQELNAVFLDQIWLSIPNGESRLSTEQSKAYSNESARLAAQLNQWCLKGFLDWAREFLEMDEVPMVWPSEAELPSIWEFVPGTAIALGNKRLVLIPSDAPDTEELSVPQEWVDIPEWAADYYLGVQVEPEEGWMRIWGFTSHQTLKTKGEYDPIFHTYALDRDFVLSDLEVLWVAYDLRLNEKLALEPIPTLSVAEADRLCEQLSQPSLYSPRLDLEFQHWAALIANDRWRNQLYQSRLQQAEVAIAVAEPVAVPSTVPSVHSAVINAALWLQDRVDQVAQELSWVLLPAFRVESTGMLGMRSAPALEAILGKLNRYGAKIPPTARSVCNDLQVGVTPLRLYTVVWPLESADQPHEWFLLFILSSQPGGELRAGTQLLVRNETEILLKPKLEIGSSDEYIYGGVSGTLSEVFSVTITLADSTSLTLPKFVFDPEVSV